MLAGSLAFNGKWRRKNGGLPYCWGLQGRWARKKFGSWYTLLTMVVRVAPGQVHFVLPHLAVDARGLSLGRDVVFRFATLERLVAFVRLVSAEMGLGELGGEIKIRFARVQGGARECLFFVEQVSPHAVETLARAARSAQGQGFTGGGRHYVLLRDTLSPLGYDVVALSSESVDLHLYASDVEIQLTFDGESSLAQLLLRLELRRVATGPEGLSPRRLPPVVCLMVRRGLGEALVEFLHHAGARAAAAMVDVPHRSGAAPEPKLWLFRVEQPPERLAGLFARTPGITAFFPVGDNLAVAAGFQHPVHLEACGRVFGEGRMVFFHPPPDPPRLFATMPQLHPISDLVRMPAPIPVAGSAQLSAVTPIDVRTRVHLVRVPPRPEAPVATLVPWTQAQWVQKLAASLPMAALSKYRIAALEQGLLIVAPENLQWFPFGILLTLAARGVLVPVGFQLRPAISRGLLEERLATRDGSVVVFPAVGAPPFRVADADLAPLENQVLGPILVNLSPAHTQTPAQAEEAPPEVRYSRGLIMPLWGG